MDSDQPRSHSSPKHGHGQGHERRTSSHAEPSYRNSPRHTPSIVTGHHDGRAHHAEQDVASRPSNDYNNPFGQPYEIPDSPQKVEMPAARPYMGWGHSYSDQQPQNNTLSPYTGGTGLVRKVSTRIQQAIEAVKVPYQPVYPATLEDEEGGGYRHGRDVDLHGELRDEWEMAPVSPDSRPLNYPYNRPDAKEAVHDDIEGKSSADIKTELTDDEKYLVSYSIEDTRHPYNWPKTKKYGILLVLCMAAVCVTATSSIQASTYNSIEREFRLSRPEAVLGVSLYVLGLGLGSRECLLVPD